MLLNVRERKYSTVYANTDLHRIVKLDGIKAFKNGIRYRRLVVSVGYCNSRSINFVSTSMNVKLKFVKTKKWFIENPGDTDYSRLYRGRFSGSFSFTSAVDASRINLGGFYYTVPRCSSALGPPTLPFRQSLPSSICTWSISRLTPGA